MDDEFGPVNLNDVEPDKLPAVNSALNTLLCFAKEALENAVTTINVWHGDEAWDEYQHSPEMININRAIIMLNEKIKA